MQDRKQLFDVTRSDPEVQDHIRLHLLAAEQLEQAAAHNRKAVQCYVSGELEQARFHAYVAEGHYIDAGPLAERLSALATTVMLLGLSRGSRGTPAL